MAAAPQPTVGILPEEADLHTAEARVNKHKADWRGWKFMWPFAVVFVFVFIIPIVYAIYISFFKKQMVGGTKFVGFENYARLIQDPQFWSSVGRVTIFTVFLNPDVLLASIANINTWEYAGYNMLIFYSSLSTIPHSLYEAASIDGASEWQIVKSIKLPELKGSLAITVIFSIIGSFQLFNEPSILQNMVPGNAITTYYTPNMYAYNLSFTGNQSNYAAALAIVMAIITMAIAYVVQLKSMKEQMK